MNTHRITVIGMVQGIGYRPFIAKLAERMHIHGQVSNVEGIVLITATSDKEQLLEFEEAIEQSGPYGARVDQIIVQEIPVIIYDSFSIIKSSDHVDDDKNIINDQYAKHKTPLIPPDLATCPDCERELLDRANRRYLYPFISCVKCGPRYSIIQKLPYDRINTTMTEFHMCDSCADDYTRKDDIRRHAQTICCPDCGPRLQLKELHVEEADTFYSDYYESDALEQSVEILKDGGIIAVKDIGGFHLACQPTNETAVTYLRHLKGREKKPFAVMFSNVEQIREYCEMSEKEQELLKGSARPIVLLRKLNNAILADNVCGNSPDIGAMLPSNPLQILLIRECGPLIMTSANCSGEQIIISNESMCSWMRDRLKVIMNDQLKGQPKDQLKDEPKGQRNDKLNDILEDRLNDKLNDILEDNHIDKIRVGILMHDRAILLPLDDSVQRVVRNRVQTFRRARGYVPEPIQLNQQSREEIYAMGGDLKSTLCFLAGNRAYLSQQIGDLGSLQANETYEYTMNHMKTLFGFHPEHIVSDLHPGYYSVNKAKEYQKYIKGNMIQIQHHQAHIASVIAEKGLQGKIIGVAFDGTGYGIDHTIWGSEFFLYDDSLTTDRFSRTGHLQQVTLLGSDEGAKNADLILCGYFNSLGIPDTYIDKWTNWLINNQQCKERANYFQKIEPTINAALKAKINITKSTSMGRLFDAVSALLNICHYSCYEGEAAIELEYLAATVKEDEDLCNLHINVNRVDNEYSSDSKELLCDIISALDNGYTAAQTAKAFILAVSDFVVEICDSMNQEKENQQTCDHDQTLKQVALSGGTFQNRILLESVLDKLENKGYEVYLNEQVPAGDGGICLGQAYLAMSVINTKE